MKLVLFSVSYAGFWGQDSLTLEEFIPHARELGFDGVEIMCKRPHALPADMSPSRLSAIRDLLTKHGLELSCCAAYTNFTAGLESREVPFADIQIAYVAAVARMAHELGGNLVRIFTGYDVAGEDYVSLWSRCVAAVQRCCDEAAKYGVTIGLQNHHDIGVDTASLLEFIRDVDRDNVAPMFDAWSPALRGEDLVEGARLMGPHALFTTVADYIRIPRYRYEPAMVNYVKTAPDMVRAVPMGDGFIEYRRFFETLMESGYSGPVSYEMCSPLRGGGAMENLDLCARRFVEYMRGPLGPGVTL